jgi:adenylate cyclase
MRELALQLDTQPGLLAAARRLRHRLPGDEKFGDPLSTAGVRPVEVVARGVSALGPERESVLQELGLAGLQLWQSLSEAAGRGRGDQPLALLFTDLVGFSSWALKAGDLAALGLLRDVGTAVETAILAHEGRIVKRLGDGLMATFLDSQAAVEAALDAQDALAEIEVDGYRPRMRAGIHWGQPRRIGGDYLGVDVNIAARVGDAAKAGEVVVSDRARDQLDVEGLRLGRSKRLRASGTPRDLQVARVQRA